MSTALLICQWISLPFLLGFPTVPDTEDSEAVPRLAKLQESPGAHHDLGSRERFLRYHCKPGMAWLEQIWVSLVSGFGPFRQHLVNSSWEAVKVSRPSLALLPSGAPEKAQWAWVSVIRATWKERQILWPLAQWAAVSRWVVTCLLQVLLSSLG
jgi:hypothetical protein